MSYAIYRDEPGGLAPAALSAVVHLVLLGMLVFGLHWQSRHPEAVQVELWSQIPDVASPPPVEAKPVPKVEPKPVPKPEVKPPPKVEQKAAKPDIAVEREKKTPKKKEEPPLKFDTDTRIQQQLAQELQAQPKPKSEAKPAAAPPVAGLPDAGYIDKIRTKIRSYVVLPEGIPGNPEAIFDVVQLPTGEVLSAKLVKSSGYQPYDDAVYRAILRSSPLPKPDRPEQFLREFTLRFKPKE